MAQPVQLVRERFKPLGRHVMGEVGHVTIIGYVDNSF